MKDQSAAATLINLTSLTVKENVQVADLVCTSQRVNGKKLI